MNNRKWVSLHNFPNIQLWYSEGPLNEHWVLSSVVSMIFAFYEKTIQIWRRSLILLFSWKIGSCSLFNQVHFLKEQLESPILFSLTSILHYDTIAGNEVTIIATTSCITALIFSIGIFTLIFLLQRSKNDLREIIKSKCQRAANKVVQQESYQNALKFNVIGICDSCVLLSSNHKLRVV